MPSLKPVHEVVVEMLEKDPNTNFLVLAGLYVGGAIVPKHVAPKLIKAFVKASEKVGSQDSESVAVTISLVLTMINLQHE